MQLFFNAQQLLRFFFFDRGNWDAGPARYHVLDVLPTDNAGGGFIEVVFFAKSTQVLALFAFFVRIEARLLELVVRDGVLHTVDDELNAFLHFSDLFGKRRLAQLYACAGFIDQVDCLIRQKAIRDVAVGVRHREVDRIVGVSDGVKLFVTILDPKQNLGGVALSWRRNLHSLEAALERTIFLD